ncbi:hypothetical protein I2485_06830 [Nesterenkonia sp. E16_7]|uniref:hypothetical protein n=1 Tax=unclassified Nesterenkonia TaxID=2629769 RepID=UPI001A939196|nr:MULTISPECIES: hypothetical protein [unclassified Nesterenkonia]MBO0596589.1 hypothetical protein [Nesterenkonia sp. E16_10]MBO0598366.1 hypothetical protein [Nesterenkonia sp. E16_7]
MELISFPNVTAALAKKFQAFAADRGIDLPVSDRTPTPRPSEFIRLWETGGDRRNLVTDRPTVTVEAYADRNSRAGELADLFRAWFYAQQGEDLVQGCPIHHVGEYARPASLPHPDTNQARYTATYSLDVRGTTL